MFGNRDHEERRRQHAVMQKEPTVSINSISWGRLLGYLKPYWKQMTIAVVALLLSTGLGLGFPLVIVRLLEAVTQFKTYGPLNTLALTLVGLFLFQAGFSFFQSYLLTYIGEHIVYDLRTSLYT